MSGEYMLPWVLLHGTKDYLHMPLVLEQYPKLHMTFNLVPCLIEQVLDYANGDTRGQFTRLCSTAPEDLSLEDKGEILRFFFSINEDKVIGRYPRYRELLEQRYAQPIEDLPNSFWLDTIGWFNLAWIDPTIASADPELRRLIGQQRFSESDLACIRRKQQEILQRILPTYRRMRDAGQIELSTSPYYHPLLPLLIDNHGAAREAAPYVAVPSSQYRHPEDAVEQVRRARVAHRDCFGTEPAGMWPSEGAVSQAIIYPLAQAGIRWIASDEEVLNRSRGWSSRTHDGSVWDPASLYSAYRVHDEHYELAMLFRDRGLSDEIGFRYQSWQAEDAARDLVDRLHGIRDALGEDRGEHIVPLILDGENCWEFYDNNGQDFLTALYGMLSDDETLRCVTVSEFLEEHPPELSVDWLKSGSWIGGTFDVWIGELAQNIAWDYLARTRDDLVRWETECEGADLQTLERAWEEIYIAEGSDWFWWYYSGNDPKAERGFDHQFRQHLINVYALMGSPIPEYLGQPILR